MRHSRFPVRHFRVPLFPSLSLFSYECTRSRAHVARRRVTPSYALRSPRNPSGYTSEYTHDVYTRVQRARTRRYSCARARARAPTRPRQGRAMCIANRITCTHIARIAHRSSRTSARFLSLSLSVSCCLSLSVLPRSSLSRSRRCALSSRSRRFFSHLAMHFRCCCCCCCCYYCFSPKLLALFHSIFFFLLAISSRNVCTNESYSSVNLPQQ